MRNKLSSLAGAAFSFAGSGLAFAADMPVKAPPPPPPAPVFNWTGFYIGGNVGGSVARNHANELQSIPSLSLVSNSSQAFTLAPAGWLGGGQIGYNWQQPGSQWVWGVEADWQWSSQKDSVCLDVCGPFATPGNNIFLSVEQRLNWLATARLRGGYTSNGWLFYATGGAAWGRITEDAAFLDSMGLFTSNGPPFTPAAGAGSFSDTKSGWTVGAGVETMLWGGWSAKLEYLYVDLGSTTHAFTLLTSAGAFDGTQMITTPMKDNVIRVGLNYKLGYTPGVTNYAATTRMALKAPPPRPAPAPAYNWTGWYVGGNVGGSIARNHANEFQLIPLSSLVLPNSSQAFTLAPAGWLGGGQIGYNWQQPGSQWVWGVEADWQWSSQKDSVCVSVCGPFLFVGENAFLSVEQRLNWFATARLRGGYTSNGWLFYATGGAAWGRITEDAAFFDSMGFYTATPVSAAGAGRFSDTKSGWTAGAGVETMLWGGWSAKLEYLYVDLGSTTHAFALTGPTGAFEGTQTITTPMKDNVIRVGVNYRFH